MRSVTGQLVYEVGQLLDEVSPLTYELGYGRLAHIYEKNPGEEPGNEAIISGCACSYYDALWRAWLPNEPLNLCHMVTELWRNFEL